MKSANDAADVYVLYVEPLRAFGDARYKWASETLQQVLPDYFPQRRGTPNAYRSPPYVTARPVVTAHAIRPQDRFLVIATDGLYDELSNQEVVQIVAGHLNERAQQPEQWCYSEKNVATGLVRNALGGRNEYKIAQLLSIPAPKSRRYRDDITVLVVLFGEEHRGRLWQDALKEAPTGGVSPSA